MYLSVEIMDIYRKAIMSENWLFMLALAGVEDITRYEIALCLDEQGYLI